MFDMLMTTARSCKNPFSNPELFTSYPGFNIKENDVKSMTARPWNFRKTISKLTTVERVREIRSDPSNHSFTTWFRNLIFASIFPNSVNDKKIQIEFTRKKIPDFDMLIKISQNRFSFMKPSVWCLLNHKSLYAQRETEHVIKGSLVIN